MEISHAVREFKNFIITVAVEDFIENACACQKKKESSFIITTDRVPRHYPAVTSDNFVANKIANFWTSKEFLRIILNQKYIYFIGSE